MYSICPTLLLASCPPKIKQFDLPMSIATDTSPHHYSRKKKKQLDSEKNVSSSLDKEKKIMCTNTKVIVQIIQEARGEHLRVKAEYVVATAKSVARHYRG